MNILKVKLLLIFFLSNFLAWPMVLADVKEEVVEESCHRLLNRDECVRIHCIKKTIITTNGKARTVEKIKEESRYWTAEQIKNEYLPLDQSHIEEIKTKTRVLFRFDKKSPFAMDTMFTYLSQEDVFEIRMYSILPVGTPICKRPEGWD